MIETCHRHTVLVNGADDRTVRHANGSDSSRPKLTIHLASPWQSGGTPGAIGPVA